MIEGIKPMQASKELNPETVSNKASDVLNAVAGFATIAAHIDNALAEIKAVAAFANSAGQKAQEAVKQVEIAKAQALTAIEAAKTATRSDSLYRPPGWKPGDSE